MIIFNLYCNYNRVGSVLDKREVRMGFGSADGDNYTFCKSSCGFAIRILPVAIGGGTFVHLPLFIAKNEKTGPYKTSGLSSTSTTVRSECLKFRPSG